MHSDHSQDDRAEDQDQGLHQVGINDRGQSAGNGVNTGGDDQDDGRRQRTPSDDALQYDRRRVEVD